MPRAFRAYFVPIVEVIRTEPKPIGPPGIGETTIKPKYFYWPFTDGQGYASAPVKGETKLGWLKCPFNDLALVGYSLTRGDHQAVKANADVLAIPPNWDAKPASYWSQSASQAELDALKNWMSPYSIPLTYLTTSDWRRTSLRRVAQTMVFLGHLYRISVAEGLGNPRDWGYNLQATASEMTAQERGIITDALAAHEVEADPSWDGGTTLREVFEWASVQTKNRRISIGTFEL